MPLIKPDPTKAAPGGHSLPGPPVLGARPGLVMHAAPAGLPIAGDVLAFLAGTWDLERQLTDCRAGQAGRFEGQAVFTPEAAGPGLCYREDGWLALGAHAGPAHRSLCYQPGPPGTAEVTFADGRAFYHLDLSTGRGQARHDCGRDCYLGEFAVLGPGEMTEHWAVSGPQKEYEFRTVLRRR